MSGTCPRRRGRWLLLVLGAAAGFAGTGAALWVGLDRSEAHRPSVPEAIAPRVRGAAERLAALPPHRERVAFLSDSIGLGDSPGDWVAAHLQRLLNDATGSPSRFGVIPFSFAAADATTFYYMAEPLLEADPAQVVLAFNLAWLSRSWRLQTSRSELAGQVPPSRLLDAAVLPLHRFGLTYDRWALLMAVEAGALADPWARLRLQQSRVPFLVLDAGRALQRRAERAEAARRVRTATAVSLAHYSGAYAGVGERDPMLRFTEAFARLATREGARLLVVADPIDVESHRRRAGHPPEGLARSVASLARVVERGGGRFLDLHDAFGADRFEDLLGHFTAEPVNGRRELAEALLPHVLAGSRWQAARP